MDLDKLKQQLDNAFTVAEIKKVMDSTYENIKSMIEAKADMTNEVLASEIHFAEKVIREYQIAVMTRLKMLSLKKKEKQNGQ